jgi:plastocyanin
MAALLVALVTACGGDSASASSGPATLQVEVKDYAFPPNLVVAPGGKVTFTTTDAEPHTVQADNGAFQTVPFGPGEAEEATMIAPSETGSYSFFCTLHLDMKGTLEVR